MKNIFLLLNKFDVPDYDIDDLNEFSLTGVVRLMPDSYALRIVLNGQKYILFTADTLTNNRCSAEYVGMGGELKFIKPKGIKPEYLINGDGEADYQIESDIKIDFGCGRYSLAQVTKDEK